MKDFRTRDFILYLNETFGGYDRIYYHSPCMVNNICHYALSHYSADPSRFIAFLRELLPDEIEEEEIKRFIVY